MKRAGSFTGQLQLSSNTRAAVGKRILSLGGTASKCSIACRVQSCGFGLRIVASSGCMSLAAVCGHTA